MQLGGAWHRTPPLKARESSLGAWTDSGAIAIATWLRNMPDPVEPCTKGKWRAPIVWQQSLAWWPCDEQGIERQQRIACSGVVTARQSDPYAANATARTARRTGFVVPILFEARRFRARESSSRTGFQENEMVRILKRNTSAPGDNRRRDTQRVGRFPPG